METCAICRKILTLPTTEGIWVKAKGQRCVRWYCKKCTKGGGKDATAGEGDRAEARRHS